MAAKANAVFKSRAVNSCKLPLLPRANCCSEARLLTLDRPEAADWAELAGVSLPARLLTLDLPDARLSVTLTRLLGDSFLMYLPVAKGGLKLSEAAVKGSFLSSLADEEEEEEDAEEEAREEAESPLLVWFCSFFLAPRDEASLSSSAGRMRVLGPSVTALPLSPTSSAVSTFVSFNSAFK